jgi:hypothetical protein
VSQNVHFTTSINNVYFSLHVNLSYIYKFIGEGWAATKIQAFPPKISGILNVKEEKDG